jgi:glycerate kinase
VRLADAIAATELVITGEGRFDFSSLRGKVVSHVSELALAAARPCVVLGGTSSVGRREAAAAGIDEVYTLADVVGEAEGFANPAVAVRRVAGAIARAWSHR